MLCAKQKKMAPETTPERASCSRHKGGGKAPTHLQRTPARHACMYRVCIAYARPLRRALTRSCTVDGMLSMCFFCSC